MAIASGCQTPTYRLTQPAGAVQEVGNQPVSVPQDPLDYRFVRNEGRLGMQVFNPTDDYITLLGKESYVVDPSGQTHPFRTGVLAPHSVSGMFLPPVQSVYHATDPNIGNGSGIGFFSHYEDFYYPFHAGYYDDFNPGPGAPYARIATTGKWGWKSGPVRLHLSYQRNGKTFDHNFGFVRDRES
ncbi:MAG: hypothetical protein JWR69_3177 [Pedosphaera sp.]|nr:hypothetical protein [Pedosphaera sp.]